MVSIVYNIFRYMEVRQDRLFRYLMGKCMIFNGCKMVSISSLFLVLSQLQQLSMIRIANLYLNLERGTETLSEFALSQTSF